MRAWAPPTPQPVVILPVVTQRTLVNVELSGGTATTLPEVAALASDSLAGSRSLGAVRSNSLLGGTHSARSLGVDFLASCRITFQGTVSTRAQMLRSMKGVPRRASGGFERDFELALSVTCFRGGRQGGVLAHH